MGIKQKDLQTILETAMDAARLAGQKAMEELEHVQISVKNDIELLTQADKKCQQIIINRIRETFPDHGFIGEEGNAGRPFKQPPTGKEQFWWVIDPIDGTNNFAYGILLFAVSIGVIYEGQPIAGVIFDPATDSMYTAVKGGPAGLNGKTIKTNQNEINRFTSIGIESYLGSKIPGWAEKIMGQTRFRSLGSTALHLAYTAKGGFAGMVAKSPKLWDIAAGAIIAESADAVISGWNGEKIFPMDLNTYSGQEIKIIASNKKIYPELLEMVKNQP